MDTSSHHLPASYFRQQKPFPVATAFLAGIRLLPWLILLCFFVSGGLQAQSVPVQPDSVADQYFNSARSDFLRSDSFASSVSLEHIKRMPVATGAAAVVAGAGIWTASFAWADEPLQQFAQRHRTAGADMLAHVVEPLGRPGYMAPLAGAVFAGGWLLKDPKLQKVGMVSLGGILISGGLTNALKHSFHRYRPSATTENHTFDGISPTSANTSLPSAHTATAFAMATTVATVYGHEYKYVPPIAYGVATLVGLSRINANAHWATDVMAGAAVGYLSARATLYLYDMASQKHRVHRQRLLLAPQPGIRAGGLSATFIF